MVELRDRYHLTVHHDDPSGLWTMVDELPGCFASGSDLPELKDAVIEAIELYTSTASKPQRIAHARWRRRAALNGERLTVEVNKPSRRTDPLTRVAQIGAAAAGAVATAGALGAGVATKARVP